MSQELATLGFDDISWSKSQISIIKSVISPGISDQELMFFSMICQRTGLDPFQRQIYAIMRNVKDGDKWVKKMTIQTGIDGYRVIAARSGSLAGIDDVEFDSEDSEYPRKATVTVWRIVQGIRCSFSATARWTEYVSMKDNKPTSMWEKMPFLMLGKCAEALALRKAFPAEMSGIYTNEEMQQADNEVRIPTVVEEKQPPPASERQKISIKKLCLTLQRQEPDYATLTYAYAQELLRELSIAYSSSKSEEA